jgi:uncharacterized protein YjbJ (UPF0337 family)
MTTNNPEDIRRDIELTRQELSRDVDALTEKVSPARVVERRVDRARDAVGSVKEKVMGRSSPAGGANGGLSAAGDSVSSAASSVAGAAASAPDQARQRTQGNPLAAGLIAFGAGWLVASLLPATEKEEQGAAALKNQAAEHSDLLKQPLSEAAGEMKDNLTGPVQQAAESVKSTAQQGVATVKDEARSATDDVADQARDAKETVAGDSSGSTSTVGGTPVGSHPSPS